MLKWLMQFLSQIKCAYHGKPLSQAERSDFNKVSISPDCFRFITALKTVHSTANNNASNLAHKTTQFGIQNADKHKRHKTNQNGTQTAYNLVANLAFKGVVKMVYLPILWQVVQK